MSYRVRFDTRAIVELNEIATHYQFQSQKAAENFESAIQNLIDLLLKNILDYHTFSGDIKMAKLYRFPYLVYYSRNEVEQVVSIHAILHSHKSDQFLKERFKT